jgi:hypothetical protein
MAEEKEREDKMQDEKQDISQDLPSWMQYAISIRIVDRQNVLNTFQEYQREKSRKGSDYWPKWIAQFQYGTEDNGSRVLDEYDEWLNMPPQQATVLPIWTEYIDEDRSEQQVAYDDYMYWKLTTSPNGTWIEYMIQKNGNTTIDKIRNWIRSIPGSMASYRRWSRFLMDRYNIRTSPQNIQTLSDWTRSELTEWARKPENEDVDKPIWIETVMVEYEIDDDIVREFEQWIMDDANKTKRPKKRVKRSYDDTRQFPVDNLRESEASYPKCQAATEGGKQCHRGFKVMVGNDSLNCQAYCSQHCARWITSFLESLPTKWQYKQVSVPAVETTLLVSYYIDKMNSESEIFERNNGMWQTEKKRIKYTDTELGKYLCIKFKIHTKMQIEAFQHSSRILSKVHGGAPTKDDLYRFLDWPGKLQQFIDFRGTKGQWQVETQTGQDKANRYEPWWKFHTFLAFYIIQHDRLPLKQIDVRQCTNPKEPLTQDNVGRIKSRISFVVPSGQVFCINRHQLIQYWNSDASHQYGYCKTKPTDEEKKECDLFYKLPFGQYAYTTPYYRDRITSRNEVAVWRMHVKTIVAMGRRDPVAHFVSEGFVENGMVYDIVPMYDSDD